MNTIFNWLKIDRSRFPEERDWLKTLNRAAFVIVYFYTWLLYSLTYFLLGNLPGALLCLFPGTTFCLVGLGLIRVCRNSEWGALTANAGALLALLMICHVTGGASSPIYSFLFVLVVCSFVLSERTTGLIFATVTILATTVNLMLHPLFPFQPVAAFFDPLHVQFDYFRILTTGLSMSLLLLLAYLFAKNLQAAYEKARAAKEQVESQKAELSQQHERLAEQRQILAEQNLQLGEAHDRLKASDRQKTHFFQNISHELRTPLTLILGSLRQLSPEQQTLKPIDTAKRNANRLLRLVNQLLDFQKLSAEKSELKLIDVDIVRFLEHIAAYFQEAAKEKCISFELKLPQQEGDQTLKVRAEIDALEKILFNFLSNALKFTPENGKIWLTLAVEGPYVTIKVKDTGPGIPEESLPRLFQIFSQVDDSPQRQFEGTGLGLALTKELALRMSGEVGVTSEVGKGSEFWFQIPVSSDLRKAYDLLLVSSDAQLASHLESSKQFGEQIHLLLVSDGGSAVDALRWHRFSAMLIDLESQGINLTALSEQGQRLQSNLKLLLVADSSRQVSTQSLNFGTQKIDRVFSRPFDGTSYQALLEILIAGRLAITEEVTDVLIVDDEWPSLMRVREALDGLVDDERLLLANSYQQALEIIKKHRIHCVVSDVNIGSEDGTVLLDEVRRLQPHSYRILLTGDTRAEVLQRAAHSESIQHLMYKPMKKEEVRTVVGQALKERRSADRPPSPSESGYHPKKDWLLADARSIPEHQKKPEIIIPEGARAKILIADDLYDMRRLVRDSLLPIGFGVIEAEDGRMAFELAELHEPDLIISDWMMPHMSGPELLERLQQHPKLKGVPTILLTAKGDEISRTEASQHGAIAYLSKPFDALELVNTTQNLLRMKEGERKVQELNRHLTEQVLTRFFPPHVLSRIQAGELAFEAGAQVMPVTVLFADLCNFTRTSAELGPRRMSDILNHYFGSMSEVIFDHGGTIDKFIGDAIMVIFGAPEKLGMDQQVRQACGCALKMQEMMDQLNAEFQSKKLPEFAMRIGIHSGPALVGMFGSEKRAEYTVIGSTVNTASRVEAAAQPGEVLVTEVVRDYLIEDNWEAAGVQRFKGISEDVPVFRLKDPKRRVA